MVASIVISNDVFSVDKESIWGVPFENFSMELDSLYSSEYSNGLSWLNHPLMGDFNFLSFCSLT